MPDDLDPQDGSAADPTQDTAAAGGAGVASAPQTTAPAPTGTTSPFDRARSDPEWRTLDPAGRRQVFQQLLYRDPDYKALDPTTQQAVANRVWRSSPEFQDAQTGGQPQGLAGQVTTAARRFQGTPYRFGGEQCGVGADCSAFTRSVMQTLGVSLPRTADAQFGAKGARFVDPSPQSMQPGDVVFLKDTYKPGISHAGVYLGGGRVAAQSSVAGGYAEQPLASWLGSQHFAGVRRYLPDQQPQATYTAPNVPNNPLLAARPAQPARPAPLSDAQLRAVLGPGLLGPGMEDVVQAAINAAANPAPQAARQQPPVPAYMHPQQNQPAIAALTTQYDMDNPTATSAPARLAQALSQLPLDQRNAAAAKSGMAGLTQLAALRAAYRMNPNGDPRMNAFLRAPTAEESLAFHAASGDPAALAQVRARQVNEGGILDKAGYYLGLPSALVKAGIMAAGSGGLLETPTQPEDVAARKTYQGLPLVQKLQYLETQPDSREMGTPTLARAREQGRQSLGPAGRLLDTALQSGTSMALDPVTWLAAGNLPGKLLANPVAEQAAHAATSAAFAVQPAAQLLDADQWRRDPYSQAFNALFAAAGAAGAVHGIVGAGEARALLPVARGDVALPDSLAARLEKRLGVQKGALAGAPAYVGQEAAARALGYTPADGLYVDTAGKPYAPMLRVGADGRVTDQVNVYYPPELAGLAVKNARGAAPAADASTVLRKDNSPATGQPGVAIIARHGDFGDGTFDRSAQWGTTPEQDQHGLTPEGREQAISLGRQFDRAGIDRVVSGDMPRTLQTASIAANLAGADHVVDPDLEKWRSGDVSGMPKNAETERLVRYYVEHPTETPPNGETFQGFMQRLVPAYERLQAEGRNTAYVLNSSAIRALHAWDAAGRPADLSVDPDVYMATEPAEGRIFRPASEQATAGTGGQPGQQAQPGHQAQSENPLLTAALQMVRSGQTDVAGFAAQHGIGRGDAFRLLTEVARAHEAAGGPPASQVVTAPAEAGGEPGLQWIDPDRIGVKPGMQYKRVGIVDEASGVTGLLKGTNVYDVHQGGVLTGWRDRDGNLWVVNGHHRLELAKRAGQFVETGPNGEQTPVPRQVPVRILDERDGWTLAKARGYGALENIRDNKGTAIPAVSVMQDLGITPDRFSERGISLTGPMARDMKGLFGLEPAALGRVQSGDVPEQVGAAIGSVAGLHPEAQHGAMDEAARSGIESYAGARRLAEIYKQDQDEGTLAHDTTGDLFEGQFSSAQSTRGERVKIEEALQRSLAKERTSLLQPVGAELQEGERINEEGRRSEAEKYGGTSRELAARVDLVLRRNPSIREEVARLATEVAGGKLTAQQAADSLRPTVRELARGSVAELADGGRLPADRGTGDAGQEPAASAPSGPGLFGEDEAAPSGPQESRAVEATSQLPRDPASEKAGEALEAQGVEADPRAVTDEMLTRLAAGQHESMGLTAEEGADLLGSMIEQGYADRYAGATELQAAVVPGAREALEAAAQRIGRIGDEVASFVNPTSRRTEVTTVQQGPSGPISTTDLHPLAAYAGGVIRANEAERIQADARAAYGLRRLRDAFDREMGSAPTMIGGKANLAHPNIQFIDAIERGEIGSLPPGLRAAAVTLRRVLDQAAAEVQQYGKLENLIADYFPHLWRDPEKAASMYARLLARRPLEGSKDFLRQRTIATTVEGIQAGLVPVSFNPVDLVLLKTAEMRKYTTFQRMVQDFSGDGLIRYVEADKRWPAGLVPLRDSSFERWGGNTIPVKEAYDRVVVDRLGKLIDSLGGVSHERKVNIGGRRWGYAVGDSQMATKFGGPESVVIHELGHILDSRYGLWDWLQKKGGNVRVPGVQGARKTMTVELRNLADLRYEGQQPTEAYSRYVRTKEEKVANAITAYVYARDKMAEVAPTVKARLDMFVARHPELRPLQDIKPSLVLGESQADAHVGGMILRGRYFAAPEVARVINNHLSPGLRGAAWYDTINYLNNIANSVQLMGGFHLGFTTVNAVANRLAVGIRSAGIGAESLLRGDLPEAGRRFGQAAVQAVTSPAAPVQYLWQGSRLLRDYYTQDPQGNLALQAFLQGGGRAGVPAHFEMHGWDALRRAWLQSDLGGTVRNLPLALIEAPGRAVMGVVTRMKLGAAADLIGQERSLIDALPQPLSMAQERARYGRVVDDVDDRFGQLAYDNLFWNRTAKDVGHLLVRSLGWDVGTLRAGGGAALDLRPGAARGRVSGEGASGSEPFVTSRMAYVPAVAAAAAMTGALIQYLHTGRGPTEWLDYFYPKTGRKTATGDDERLSIPSYLKDWQGFGTEPVATAEKKGSPVVNVVRDLAENRDWQGRAIYDPQAPEGERMRQIAGYLGRQLTPIGVTADARRAASGGGVGGRVETASGVVPAPVRVVRSRAENLMSGYLAQRVGGAALTPEQAQRHDLRADLLQRAHRGEDIGPAVGRAVGEGRLSRQQAGEIMRDRNTDLRALLFRRLTLPQALDVYEAARPDERQALRQELGAKVLHYGQRGQLTPDLRARYQALVPATQPPPPGFGMGGFIGAAH